MTIDTLINKFFGATERAVVEKPSFAQVEVSESYNGVRITLSPRSSTTLAMPAQLLKQPMIVTPAEVSAVAQKLGHVPFVVLYDLEGFYVGGMSQAACTCGKEPVWIYSSQLSKEPGREKHTILSEMRLSSNPADHVHSAKGIRLQSDAIFEFIRLSDNRYLALVKRNAPAPAYQYPNRAYEITALLTAEESEQAAKRLAAHKGTPSSMQNGLITYDDLSKGISPCTIFRRIPFGSLVYASLMSFYIELKGTKDRDSARALAAAVFKGK
jgi:hypothetical protein